MKTYCVSVRLIVKAKSAADARELGVGAIEHLVETFNDDESILYGQVDETWRHDLTTTKEIK